MQLKTPQLSLFAPRPYREVAHAKTTTSHHAALKIETRVEKLKRLIVEELARGAKTADELAFVLSEKYKNVAPRLSEMKADGVVEYSGEKRPNADGSPSVVWQLRKSERRAA